MDFNRELPHFLAEIKRLFSLTELGSYFGGLERRSSSGDPSGLPCAAFVYLLGAPT